MNRFFAGLLFTSLAFAQAPSISGAWQVTLHQLGAPQYYNWTIVQDGDKVSATFARYHMSCTLHGNVCEGEFRAENDPSAGGKLKLVISGQDISGDGTDEDGPFTFTGHRAPERSAAKTVKFTPTKFYNYFSSRIEPALRINPGDTVETTSVDAGGRDENNVRRAPGGNPLTGPFYVEGAFPGDTLVVKLNRLRLNRASAGSGNEIVASALGPYYFRGLKSDDKFSSEWTLDREHGVARPAKPSEHMKNYTVALKPMLGCIGVAPPQDQSYRSGFLGGWGGNMDYREFGEGVTLYFAVNHPGALLFLGDGHAAQGAGELTGDALETSMEFSFTAAIDGKDHDGKPYYFLNISDHFRLDTWKKE